MEMVRKAKDHGCIVGSSSDKPIPVQEIIWEQHDISVSFVSAKYQLADVKARFEAQTYYHVGDTELDQQFALAAGFVFLWMDSGHSEPWLKWDMQ